MDQFLQLLNYLGITPSQIVPSLLVGAVFLAVVNKWFVRSINNNIKMITDEVRDLHNAAKEIQIHLSTDGFTPQHSLEQKPLFEQYGQHSSPMQPSQKGAKLLDSFGNKPPAQKTPSSVKNMFFPRQLTSGKPPHE